MLKGLAGITTHDCEICVPIFDNTQDIPALAAQMRAKLDSDPAGMRHAFLIRGHGLYTWGRDLAEARRHVEILEFLFEVTGRRLALDAARPTPEFGSIPF
jgi:methylthioribulose-1-phosphate dehydratase